MILKRPMVFTGTVHNMTAYFSKSGQCIIRVKSSITGARISKDPVFEGFRQSGVRMKDASPIAAELYNQIPKEKKEFKLYRTLTGEALKMLKQGINKKTIIEKLQELYIDPVFNKRTRTRRRRKILQHSDGSVKMFSREGGKEIYYKRDNCYKEIGDSISSPSNNNSPPIISSPQRMYLGRNKLYREFKVWLLPTGEEDPGLYSGLYRHTIESCYHASVKHYSFVSTPTCVLALREPLTSR